MSDESRQVETVLDQFGLKRLYSRNRTFSDSRKRTVCEVQRSSPYETKIAAALPGCCEFATGIITPDSVNRTCSAADFSFVLLQFSRIQSFTLVVVFAKIS